jgi:AraC family transcriptional regulator
LDWQNGMNQAIDHMEARLCGEVDLVAAAQCVGCSSWEFQRLFSFLAHIPVGEYIRRRRLSLAAMELNQGEHKVIDVAIKYGYDSPAAFSRAFAQLFGVSPSSARSEGVRPQPYPRLRFQYSESGWKEKMSKFGERGYVVRENGPVYFTQDMDATVKWFEDVLGWYGDVVARRPNGKGDYGCVFDYPDEVAVAHLTPFRGFHLFTGEPAKGVAGFLMVEGLDALYNHVKSAGWDQITEIADQPWSARECAGTTPDGCILRFFEEKK